MVKIDVTDINEVNNTTSIHLQSFTKNGYIVVKINREKRLTAMENVFDINFAHLLMMLIPVFAAFAIFTIKRIMQSKKVVSLKVKVRSSLIGDYYTSTSADEKPISKELSDNQNSNVVYILAKSIVKYPDNLLLQFFRTLCGIGMNIVVLLEKYPSKEASRIVDLINNKELKECIKLKYIRKHENIELINIMKVDEILEFVNMQLSSNEDIHRSKDDSITSSEEVSHKYNVDKQKQLNKNKYVIVFGRKNRYFIRKELYDTLKQGISLEELRKKYNDRIYNLIMDMYNDGIIINSNGKVFLID